MNDGEAANCKEYYLDTLEDPNTGMPNFPNLVMFLVDVRKAFWAADWVRDAVNRLEMLRQGKKTAKELNTEFLQIVGQAGMDRKTPSDHLHLIGYYRKALEPRLSHKILFSDNVPQDIKKTPSKQKADTNKSNGNAHWWRTKKRRNPKLTH
jgi:hypothetical protein